MTQTILTLSRSSIYISVWTEFQFSPLTSVTENAVFPVTFKTPQYYYALTICSKTFQIMIIAQLSNYRLLEPMPRTELLFPQAAIPRPSLPFNLACINFSLNLQLSQCINMHLLSTYYV